MYGNSFGKASKANILEKAISRRPGQTFSELIIKCKCHAKILVIPDLKAMSKALKTHMMYHRKIEKDKEKTNSKVTKLIEDDLIAEVFKKATGLKI